ncbi:MAG: anhydro-N-acetylmuramic acid kinase [Sphingomonadaceae bacterium]|nr:anhydro-N-acetylmuramic acid kinase [Sphingomonadaceae bacterium]
MEFVIGLMSGTSRDGVDAVLIKTDGLSLVTPIAFQFEPYPDYLRSAIADACDVAMSCTQRQTHPIIEHCEQSLSERHLTVTHALLKKAGVLASEISLIGLHGHTIAHRADLGWTWQIGKAEFLANQLDIPVMSNMRQYDVMYGGQGAPLIPVFHRALFADTSQPVAVLNLGGVANLTFIGRDGALAAFDCGMANALIDDWMSRKTNYPYDEGGDFAATGVVDATALGNMLEHPFFSASFPKSLDRKDFNLDFVEGLSAGDGAATLTAFSARAVAIGLRQLPAKPKRLIVCGGGRKNRTMIRMIEQYCEIPAVMTDDLGWDGDAIEAQGFAYLAYRCLHGLPITYPGTTGVPEPMSGGVLTRPEKTVMQEVPA